MGRELLLLAVFAAISFQAVAASNKSTDVESMGFVRLPISTGPTRQKLPPNPRDILVFGLANNIYRTSNYIIGAYHFISCFGNEFIRPQNTKETAQAIAHYYKQAQDGSPVVLRASRPQFHSSATFPCAAGPGEWQWGTRGEYQQGPRYIGLLQDRMTLMSYDSQAKTIRAGGGTTLAAFWRFAASHGMSWKLGSVPVYGGLTLAGVLAASGHGTGYNTTTGIWDTLNKIVWVDGHGSVHVSKPGDVEFRAMAGGLGAFGVITELEMQMTPTSLTTINTIDNTDENMFGDVQSIVANTPHTLVFWRPDAKAYRAFTYSEASPDTPFDPSAVASILPSYGGRPRIASILAALQNSLPDDSQTEQTICPILVGVSLDTYAAIVPNPETGNWEGVREVTGLTNQLLSSECGEHCAWDDQHVTNDTAQDLEFTIEFDQLESWIADVKKIFWLDLFEDGSKPWRCLTLGYIWLRFGQGLPGGITATVSDMKAPVFVQTTFLRSRQAAPDTPIRHQYVLDLIEEMTLCNYNGRPHWGKNFDRTFTHPSCGIGAKYPKFDDLKRLAREYDPTCMFEGSLVKQVFSGASYRLSPRCSTWQKCFCQEDSHCPPSHRCVPSLSFPDHKVCKASRSDEPGSLLQQPGVVQDLEGIFGAPPRLPRGTIPWGAPLNVTSRASAKKP